jgi:MFS family permease
VAGGHEASSRDPAFPGRGGAAKKSPSAPRLGLRVNAWQFGLYTAITLLVGMTIGVERVALPPLAHHAFGVTSDLSTVSFISAFGAVKAVMNLVSGRFSDRRGRKGILLAGWAFAVPYVLLIVFATAWWEVIVANLFLGVNQALTWTMSVTAKIDLVGPAHRGLAVGVDESAGYVGTGLGGVAAGFLVASYGLRPAPYLLALGVVVLGAAVTAGPAAETVRFARSEAGATTDGGRLEEEPTIHAGGSDRASTLHAAGREAGGEAPAVPGLCRLTAYMSWRDRSMLAVCQAGLFNKFADSLVAAFFPLYLVRHGVPLAEVGVLVGVYAWVWGLGQVASGALADRIGRKLPVTAGTFVLAAGLVLFVASDHHSLWFVASAVMGLGMALAYPNLITAVGDTAGPAWRGGALGVYRLWRDGGYAVGPLVLGAVAAAGGIASALWVGAALVAASGLVLAVMLAETDPERRTRPPAWQAHPEWVAPARGPR